jgi:hypothetical protein
MTLKEKFEQYAKEEIWRTRNYNAEECELIADEFAIGFAEWCDENYNTLKPYDVGNILQKYKKEKGL